MNIKIVRTYSLDHCLESWRTHWAMSSSWQTHVCAHVYLAVWTNLKNVLENQTDHTQRLVREGGTGAFHCTTNAARLLVARNSTNAHLSDGETALSRIGDQCRFFREELIRYLQQWVNRCFSLLLISTPEFSSRVYMSIPYWPSSGKVTDSVTMSPDVL